ncbi:MAG: GNAT family N-acetyltransferase [Alphaproteobacteria bacterium]|nr:GNAT family N-acetyltransferase [Alphaproteobacteria bacterium]
MQRSGYVPIHRESPGIGAVHRRVGQRVDLPPTPRLAKRVLKVVPVSTAEEFEKALAIRHVFLSEQSCPYHEEFDGNDRTGTHFLGFVDGEPAATLRVRYFADFVKLERLAVLPRFRRTLIAKEVVTAAVNFCRRKGYRRCVGHAQEHLVRFWQKFGFQPTPRDYVLTFSDRDYIEMYGDFEPDPRAITIETDPYVMIRPEGRWDEPGILERSAGRPAVNPCNGRQP